MFSKNITSKEVEFPLLNDETVIDYQTMKLVQAI